MQGMMQRILFITSTRIGDAILSMGILARLAAENPEARFTIVCGTLPASLFEGFPQLERIITLTKKSYHLHWLDLWREVRTVRWESVVDLRNTIISRVVIAKHKFIFGKHIPSHLHKAEQNARVMGYKETPVPQLFFTSSHLSKAAQLVPAGEKILGVGPTANWIGKTWPRENFVELLRRLTARGAVFHNWRVAVFAAPGEEDDAQFVLQTVPEDNRIDLIAKTNPAVAAACLARCHFYIGNDSGLMHAAAAAGIPTLGLFGASYVDIYGPCGAITDYAHTPQSYDDIQRSIPDFDPKTIKHSLMTDLTVDAVEQKAKTLAQRAGLFIV
jgi:heptosyltransferase III